MALELELFGPNHNHQESILRTPEFELAGTVPTLFRSSKDSNTSTKQPTKQPTTQSIAQTRTFPVSNMKTTSEKIHPRSWEEHAAAIEGVGEIGAGSPSRTPSTRQTSISTTPKTSIESSSKSKSVSPERRPVTSTGPAPALAIAPVALPSKSLLSSFRSMIGSKMSSLFHGSNVVKLTPPSLYAELKAEYRFGYMLQRNGGACVPVKQIADSSEGEVWVMEQMQTSKLFVCKRTRYPNEARVLLGHLRTHPNIINLYECVYGYERNGCYSLWMEKCDDDLFQQMEFAYGVRRSTIDERLLLHFIVEAVQSLAYLHHGLRWVEKDKYTLDRYFTPIVHGDIKSENFFLRWSQSPLGGLPDIVLGDFGTARLASDTKAQIQPGTLIYLAPEDKARIADARPCIANALLFYHMANQKTTASDIYAFGQIVYQIACKERNPMPIGQDPADLRVSRDYQNGDLVKELLVRCLAVDPAQRAEASFNEERGILPLVHKLRDARKQLIATRYPLDRMDFRVPPPVQRRA